jgi:hypothetical protein
MWLRSLVVVIALGAVPLASQPTRAPQFDKQQFLSVLPTFVAVASQRARAEDPANAHAPLILGIGTIVSAVQSSVGVTLDPREVSAAIDVPYVDGASENVIHCFPPPAGCRVDSGAVVVRIGSFYKWEGSLVFTASYFWPKNDRAVGGRIGLVMAEFWFRKDGDRWTPTRFTELARDSLP